MALIGRTGGDLFIFIRQMDGGEERHFAVEADVGNEIEMIAAYELIARRWNQLDIVVANAGQRHPWLRRE